MKNNSTRKVAVRDLQHNLVTYLEMAKITPLVITKYGKEEILMINPVKYDCVKKTNTSFKVRGSRFIGMYKGRKDWEGLSNSAVAGNLRNESWYGK